MALTGEKKLSIIDSFKLHEHDTGSPEVQIAILTEDKLFDQTLARA